MKNKGPAAGGAGLTKDIEAGDAQSQEDVPKVHINIRDELN
jgi:hypothetical protein